MKKCGECNIEMLENFGIRSDEPNSIDNSYKLYIVKNDNDYYGRRINSNYKINNVKCRICPNCGKVELYIDTNILNYN